MNRDAQNAYAASHADLLAKLDKLRERIEDLPAPDDDTNWGHVGDLASLHQALAPIIDTLDGWEADAEMQAFNDKVTAEIGDWDEGPRPPHSQRKCPGRPDYGNMSEMVLADECPGSYR